MRALTHRRQRSRIFLGWWMVSLAGMVHSINASAYHKGHRPEAARGGDEARTCDTEAPRAGGEGGGWEARRGAGARGMVDGAGITGEAVGDGLWSASPT